MLRITIFIRLIFEVIALQRISSVQPMRTPKTADFGFSFYAPYEAAVETAFLALCAARMQLEEESTPFAVRSMTFRLKSPASIRDKLTRRGLPQNAEGAAYLARHRRSARRAFQRGSRVPFRGYSARVALVAVCLRAGLHRRAEEERLPQSASGDARAHLPKRKKRFRSRGNSAAHTRDGYVGLCRA